MKLPVFSKISFACIASKYKNFAVVVFVCLVPFISNGQLAKGDWLVGGNINFSFSNQGSNDPNIVKLKQTQLTISPSAGYFLKDKFALGLKPSIAFGHVNMRSSTTLGIGSFVRYYFFDPESIVNLFSEGGYTFSTLLNKNLSASSHTFSISAGPVLFFNTSIGLEFPITYSFTKLSGDPGNGNEIKFGIGFKYYLEKQE